MSAPISVFEISDESERKLSIAPLLPKDLAMGTSNAFVSRSEIGMTLLFFPNCSATCPIKMLNVITSWLKARKTPGVLFMMHSTMNLESASISVM